MIEKRSMKVETLEKISKVLGVEIGFWWEDEPGWEINEPEVIYENRKLKEENDRSRKTIDHLNDQIDLLNEKYGIKDKKKEERCG